MSSGADVRLVFINKTMSVTPQTVLIFQKNISPDLSTMIMAWKIIKDCPVDWSHSFIYPTQLYVSCGDLHGNRMPRFAVQTGQALAVCKIGLTQKIIPSGQAQSPYEFEVRNELPQGAIDIFIFRGPEMLCRKTSVSPGQKGVFAFEPTLWIGAVSQVEEGAPLSSAIISQTTTIIPLVGIKSADIVMTGGGAGEATTPYRFSLENIHPY